MTFKRTSSNDTWREVYSNWRKSVNNRSGHPVDKTEIRNATDPTELMIYDEIGYWGVTAQRFVSELNEMTGPITVKVNSPGGDMFDGLAIYNALLAYPDEVTAQIDGLAASAASFIVMAASVINAAESCMMMIHDAIGVTMGNAADMMKSADMLDKSSNNIAAIYAKRAGGTMEDWRALMREETWYTGNEAMDSKLVDALMGMGGESSTENKTRQTIVMVSNPGLTPDKPIATDDPTVDVAIPETPAYTASANDFKFALADATKSDDAPDPVFTWDRDVFTSALNEVFSHAPAPEPEPQAVRKPAQSPIRDGRVDLSALADALQEGLR
jgi:ATP-dependent protease ClpP protease subunit